MHFESDEDKILEADRGSWAGVARGIKNADLTNACVI